MALVEAASKVSAVERAQGDREKHGAFTGRYVVNPVNGEKVPVWVADYIVADYGTGAVMAVPCGDQRDFEFARKYDLPIIPIILGEDDALYPQLKDEQNRVVTTVDWEKSYEAEGKLVQSGKYTGMVGGKHSPAVDAIIGDLEAAGKGKKSVQFRLRDWLISRQPPGDLRQRRAVLELLLDGHAVPLGELPVLASRHSLHLPSPECRWHDGIRWDSGGEPLLSETKCTERAFQIRIKACVLWVD